ncbi:heterokaryon incompatibility protein-domain-containing protein [Apodospora peruviana]|uniref:Heterokaryon incompatibility protein-domain-containing protein n=1 Tax=Apodospora peruviana TaxID=516989 RepID=A0AAE0MG14_9PEZI|nr:heterokaryon incompatibility protein-domain-containing protein [Apodospora peruviana]
MIITDLKFLQNLVSIFSFQTTLLSQSGHVLLLTGMTPPQLYQPLNNEACEIRLLTLLPNDDLDEVDGSFQALSYAWGDPFITTGITGHSEPVICWVDAVCINQDDEAEKSSLAQLMGDIYRGAESVIVWLGEARDDSDMVMDMIRVDSVAKGPDSDAQTIKRRGLLVEAFMNREWWSRL